MNGLLEKSHSGVENLERKERRGKSMNRGPRRQGMWILGRLLRVGRLDIILPGRYSYAPFCSGNAPGKCFAGASLVAVDGGAR